MNTIKLSDIFFVSYGTKLDMNKMTSNKASDIAFVSRSSKNNGVVDFVDKLPHVEPLGSGLITVTLGGTYVLSSFLQNCKFYTAQNVAVLTAKTDLSAEEKLFYCLCISKNRFRYSAFGREANRSLKDILVPSRESIPDYVRKIDTSKITVAKKRILHEDLDLPDVKLWSSFKLNKLFEMKKGKRLTKANLKSGKVPFIAAIDNNNGCRELISHEPIHQGNTISVNYNGSVAEAFYQPVPFYASDDVNVLYPNFDMNIYTAMFIITIIKQEKYRFNYGRKWHLERMSISTIKLPSTIDNEPDFILMENFIKTLNYSRGI